MNEVSTNMVQLEPNWVLMLKHLAPSGVVLSAETAVSHLALQGHSRMQKSIKNGIKCLCALCIRLTGCLGSFSTNQEKGSRTAVTCVVGQAAYT